MQGDEVGASKQPATRKAWFQIGDEIKHKAARAKQISEYKSGSRRAKADDESALAVFEAPVLVGQSAQFVRTRGLGPQEAFSDSMANYRAIDRDHFVGPAIIPRVDPKTGAIPPVRNWSRTHNPMPISYSSDSGRTWGISPKPIPMPFAETSARTGSGWSAQCFRRGA